MLVREESGGENVGGSEHAVGDRLDVGAGDGARAGLAVEEVGSDPQAAGDLGDTAHDEEPRVESSRERRGGAAVDRAPAVLLCRLEDHA
jgi:hypothetical protein